MPRRPCRQPDLFDPSPDLFDAADPFAAEADEDRRQRVARLEQELDQLLARVRSAERLPFRDLTEALLAELRFMHTHHEIADGAAKCAAFLAEMQRLYAIEAAQGRSEPTARLGGSRRRPARVDGSVSGARPRPVLARTRARLGAAAAPSPRRRAAEPIKR